MENVKTEKDQLVDLERLRQQDKYDEFFTTAEKAITDYPDSYPVKFLYASALAEMQRLAEAESVLKDLMITFPDNINLLLELGKVTFALAKHTEAAEFYNKILFLDPFNAQAKTELEKIKSLQSGQPGASQAPPPPVQKPAPPVQQTASPPLPPMQQTAPPPTPVQQPAAPAAAPSPPPGLDTAPLPPPMQQAVPPPPPPPGLETPDMEFEIPSAPGIESHEIELEIPDISSSPPVPAAAPAPPPGLDTAPAPPPGLETVPLSPSPAAELPGAGSDMDFEIPSASDMEGIRIEYETPVQEQPVDLEASPPVVPAAPEGKEFDIPAVPGVDRLAGVKANEVEDTILEMETPDVPKIEQGPPLPPPSAGIPDAEEYDIPSGQDFDQESLDIDYEAPVREQALDLNEMPVQEPVQAQAPAPPAAAPPVSDEEFEIPSMPPQAGQDVFGEMPVQEPVHVQAPAPPAAVPPINDTEFEIPSIPPQTGQDVFGEMPVQEQASVPPAAVPPAGSPAPGQEGGNEGEFMTESAAELYVSQGLFDDAEAIYKKLYQAKQDEKYLHKIKQISGKRVKNKKVQVLDRFLKIIEKKGEKVV